MSPAFKTVARVCLISLATAAVIYLTPLRYINFIAPTMHEVSPIALNAEYQANPSKYLLIDVRPPTDYVVGHIPNSINIPIYDLVEQWQTLPHFGKTIVLICSDGRLATVAYGYLEYHGFFNLQHLTDGLDAWEAAQLPVKVGDQ